MTDMTVYTNEGCQRAHPHEWMDEACNLRTIITNIRNKLDTCRSIEMRSWVEVELEDWQKLVEAITGDVC
jgi:hypothetical protein